MWPSYNASTDPMLQIDDVSVQINGFRTQQCDFYDANATVFSTLQWAQYMTLAADSARVTGNP